MTRGQTKLGRQENGRKAGRVTGRWEPRARGGCTGAGVVAGGRWAGSVSRRAFRAVLMTYLNFHVATGCRITAPGDLQRRQGGFRFWTWSHLSFPIEPCFFSHLLNVRVQPFFHLFNDASICLGLSLILPSTPVFWAVKATLAGQMDRSLPLWLLWGPALMQSAAWALFGDSHEV